MWGQEMHGINDLVTSAEAGSRVFSVLHRSHSSCPAVASTASTGSDRALGGRRFLPSFAVSTGAAGVVASRAGLAPKIPGKDCSRICSMAMGLLTATITRLSSGDEAFRSM
jgi:hypothetical protein